MRVPKYGCHNLASPLLSSWSLWTVFTSCCPLSWRSFCFRCVVVDPCFIHCYIPTQKILLTSLKQLQTALWILDALLFLVGVRKRRTYFQNNLRIPNDSCIVVNTLPSDIFNVSAISHNFNVRSPKTDCWFPWCGVPITLVKPLLCLNSIFAH